MLAKRRNRIRKKAFLQRKNGEGKKYSNLSKIQGRKSVGMLDIFLGNSLAI